MTRKIIACGIMALLLMSNGVMAKEYTAYQMAKPPAIDGNLDDSGWKNIPFAHGFKNLYEKWSFSQKQTSFKMGYDQNFLYLAIRCLEPEMAKVKTGERAFDGWPTTLDDVYFIYANTYNQQGTWADSPFKILQLGAGGIHRAYNPQGDVTAPLEWKTAYRADDRNWYLEAAVPLKFLEIDPAKGGWFNIVRHFQTISGSRTLRTSSWTEVNNSKLDQHTLVALHFSGNNGVVDLDRQESEPAYGWWLGQLLGKIKDRGGEYAAAKSRVSNSPNWPLAEKVRQQIENVLQEIPSSALGIGAKSDAYLNWLFALSQMAETSAPVSLDLKLRDATAKLFVNGQEVKAADGIYKLLLSDGVNVLAVEAKACGPNPGIAVQLPDFPETDGRWKTAAVTTGEWQTADFDDCKWAVPSMTNGWMWSAANAGTGDFRQLLLWSRNFYGGKLAAIVPPHTEYGISPGTTEVLQHAIFPPISQPMESYIYQVEVPVGFRLLETKCPIKRSYCWYPDEVSTNAISVNGKKYRQYTLKFDVSKLEEAYAALLPVKYEDYDKAQGPATFRFRRLINANITELTTALTVNILPPVNGRCMKKIFYPQYDHQSHRSISQELLVELVRQSVASGMDMWFVFPEWPDARSANYVLSQKTIRECGGRMMACFPSGMPLWGAEKNTELYKLVKENSKFAAVYFNNTGNRQKDWSLNFCFTYALGEGRQAFAEALQKDYQGWKNDLPESEYVFFNNENYPWEHQGTDIKPGTHCYCFCGRCKNAFRQFAQLPADKQLPDQEIYDNYREEWAKFWKSNQSGRLMELVTEVAHKVGLKTIYYHNTGDKYAWQTVAGKADLYNVGFPGGAAFVGRDSQIMLDDWTAFCNSVGIKQFIGQRRTYFPFGGRYRQVFSKDGCFLNPKHLKTEIVRMAATTRGGVTYESVMQLTGGSLYYFGEATRLIAAYEDMFWDGKREDSLADAGDYKYPDILVLTRGNERLVLVFNETTEAKTLDLTNHKLKPGQQAEIFEQHGKIADPRTMTITVPPEDVAVVYIK